MSISSRRAACEHGAERRYFNKTSVVAVWAALSLEEWWRILSAQYQVTTRSPGQCILGAYMKEIHLGGVNLMNLRNNQTLHTAPFPPIRTTCTTTSNPGLHADWKWSDWKHPNTAWIHVSGEIKKSKTALLFHPSFEGWNPSRQAFNYTHPSKM